MQKFQAAIINKKSNQPDINWTDFNFPPLLRLFHFDLSELQDPYKSLVRLLYISYWLIFAATLINILSNGIQASYDYPGIRLLFSFMNLFLFNGIQMYIFYRGYKGLCAEQGLLKLYKIFHLIAGILWLIVAIIDVLGFNGFARADRMNSEGLGGLVFLTVIESLLFLFSFLLAPLCVYRVHSFNFDTGISSDNL